MNCRDDFDEVIENLKYIDTSYPKAMGDELSSKAFNENMNTIEFRLNLLYEKTRLLQDLADYAREFITTEIEAKKASFKEKLKLISEVTDSYRDKNSVAQLVPLIACAEQIEDRDGSIIPPMEIADKKIVPPGNTLAAAKIKSVTGRSIAAKFSTNYDQLSDNTPANTVYISDSVFPGGLDEEVTITLETNENEMNYIDIPVTNGEITKYTITLQNGSKKEITPEDKYIDDAKIKSVTVNINTKNYSVVTQSVKENQNTSVFEQQDNAGHDTISDKTREIIRSVNEKEISKA